MTWLSGYSGRGFSLPGVWEAFQLTVQHLWLETRCARALGLVPVGGDLLRHHAAVQRAGEPHVL